MNIYIVLYIFLYYIPFLHFYIFKYFINAYYNIFYIHNSICIIIIAFSLMFATKIKTGQITSTNLNEREKNEYKLEKY